jgi:hypothetical protein
MRELLLVADVSSGTIRATDGLVVQNAPGIEPVDPSRPELGQVYRLQANQTDALTFSFSLPDGSSGIQIEIAASNQNGVPATIAISINGNSQNISMDSQGQLITVLVPGDSITADLNEIALNVQHGILALQVFKIHYALPFPVFEIPDTNEQATLTFIMPAATGVTVGKGEPISLNWTTSNPSDGAYAKLLQHSDNGRLLPIPEATKVSLSSSFGSIVWKADNDVKPLVEAYDVNLDLTKALLSLEGPRKVRFSQDWQYAVVEHGFHTGDFGDGKFRAWNLKTSQPVKMLTDDTTIYRNALICPASHYLLTNTAPSDELAIWELSTGKLIEAFPASLPPIEPVEFFPDGDSVLSSVYGELRVFRLSDHSFQDFTSLAGRIVEKATLSPDGTKVLLWSSERIPTVPFRRDPTILLIDVLSGAVKWKATRDGTSDTIIDATFFESGEQIVVTERIFGAGNVFVLKKINASTGNSDGTMLSTSVRTSWHGVHVFDDLDRLVAVELEEASPFWTSSIRVRRLSDFSLIGQAVLDTGVFAGDILVSPDARKVLLTTRIVGQKSQIRCVELPQ